MSATQIIPQLWIGDKVIAQQKSFFDEKHIDVVVNCTKEVKFIEGTKTYRLDIDDDLTEDSIRLMYKSKPEFPWNNNTLSVVYSWNDRWLVQIMTGQ